MEQTYLEKALEVGLQDLGIPFTERIYSDDIHDVSIDAAMGEGPDSLCRLADESGILLSRHSGIVKGYMVHYSIKIAPEISVAPKDKCDGIVRQGYFESEDVSINYAENYDEPNPYKITLDEISVIHFSVKPNGKIRFDLWDKDPLWLILRKRIPERLTRSWEAPARHAIERVQKPEDIPFAIFEFLREFI